MSKLKPWQIVLPSGRIEYIKEYLATERIYLQHIINPLTGRCYCGRDAHGWDLPYRTTPDEIPTTEEVLQDDDAFCRQCLRALKKVVDDEQT